MAAAPFRPQLTNKAILRIEQIIAEVIGQWHTGRNTGDTPVRLLVIDQIVPGHSNTVLRSEKMDGDIRRVTGP